MSKEMDSMGTWNSIHLVDILGPKKSQAVHK